MAHAAAKVAELHTNRRVDAVEEERYKWDTKEQGEAARPYRLWDATNRCNMRVKRVSNGSRAVGASSSSSRRNAR